MWSESYKLQKNEEICKCIFNISSENKNFIYNTFTLLKVNLQYEQFCVDSFGFSYKKSWYIWVFRLMTSIYLKLKIA